MKFYRDFKGLEKIQKKNQDKRMYRYKGTLKMQKKYRKIIKIKGCVDRELWLSQVSCSKY